MVAKGVKTMSKDDYDLFNNSNSPSSIIKYYDWSQEFDSNSLLERHYVFVEFYRVIEK